MSCRFCEYELSDLQTVEHEDENHYHIYFDESKKSYISEGEMLNLETKIQVNYKNSIDFGYTGEGMLTQNFNVIHKKKTASFEVSSGINFCPMCGRQLRSKFINYEKEEKL